MSSVFDEGQWSGVFVDVSPGTFQQYTTLLLERLAASELPEMGGIIRLHGRWTNPGRASGKHFYGVKIVDDGGAQAKIEILSSLVGSRGIVPGHRVIATGRLAVRSTNYGIDLRLVATDIQLDEQEQAEITALAQQGRMTIDRLRSIPLRRVLFPDQDTVSVTLIQSTSATAQVSLDCMAELTKLGAAIRVVPVKVNMLDPVAIATAIQDASGDGILMIIRGGGDAADFELFDDPRIVTALANQHAHRVVGLGHTGNTTLLDMIADATFGTPAQAGTYVRERVKQRQQVLGDAGKELILAKERTLSLERERNAAQAQLATARELLAKSTGLPVWTILAAFLAGATIVFIAHQVAISY